MKPFRLVLAIAVAFSCSAFAQHSGEKRGPGGHRGPPPEALAACEGKAAGAGCSFSHGEHNVQGSCFTPASDKPLACKPEGPPPEGAPDQRQ